MKLSHIPNEVHTTDLTKNSANNGEYQALDKNKKISEDVKDDANFQSTLQKELAVLSARNWEIHWFH